MITIIYRDINGYGTVHARGISIYTFGSVSDEPMNPNCLISSWGTYYFGTNRVLFQMD